MSLEYVILQVSNVSFTSQNKHQLNVGVTLRMWGITGLTRFSRCQTRPKQTGEWAGGWVGGGRREVNKAGGEGAGLSTGVSFPGEKKRQQQEDLALSVSEGEEWKMVTERSRTEEEVRKQGRINKVELE